MTPESPRRRVVCASGRMSLVRLFFRRESRRTLGGSRPCRVGHLLGGPREHARPFRFLRALVVFHPRGDDRRRVCRCGCAEVGSSPCFLSGLVVWAGPPVDDRRGGGDSSQPSCGAHRSCSIMGTGRSRRRTSAFVSRGVLGQARARVAPSSIRRCKQHRQPSAWASVQERPPTRGSFSQLTRRRPVVSIGPATRTCGIWTNIRGCFPRALVCSR